VTCIAPGKHFWPMRLHRVCHYPGCISPCLGPFLWPISSLIVLLSVHLGTGDMATMDPFLPLAFLLVIIVIRKLPLRREEIFDYFILAVCYVCVMILGTFLVLFFATCCLFSMFS